MFGRATAVRSWKLGAVAGLGLLSAAAAGAAPANDNFANAIAIGNLSGTATGTNSGASLESGEPNFINTDDYASVDNSVWYKWTAPSNGVVAFDTFGSSFDTVLAVYTNSFSTPIVAGNDDYIATIIPQSQLSFTAVAGTTYYISVNGNPYPVPGYTDAGSFVLNWSETIPTIPSGTFQFTSSSYVVSDYESNHGWPINAAMATVPPIWGARVTITRTNGSSGRVKVPYTVVGDATQTAAGANTNGWVVFDDYQMSADIVVPVTYLTPTDIAVGTNFFSSADPGQITVTLGTPVLDPMESIDLLPPTASTTPTTITVDSADYPDSFSANGLPYFNFERATFRVRENQGSAVVYVYPFLHPPDKTVSVQYAFDRIVSDKAIIRTYNWFPLQAGSDYATINEDFTDVDLNNDNNKLTWGPGDNSPKPITISITDDTNSEFNEDIEIELYNPRLDSDLVSLGQVNTATVTILDDDQPAGAVDRTWNQDAVNTSTPPFLQYPGTQGGVSDSANGNGGTVYAVAEQPDGKSIIAGSFISFDSNPYNRIVRVLTNGFQDTTFLAPPNSGANDFIAALALQPDGKIIIGGNFTSFNGVNRYHVARLNADGSVDTTFNPGLGANGKVWAVGLQSDGKIFIGGEFTSYNGTNCNYLARLNADGSLDTEFASSNLLNGPVYALAVPPFAPIDINRDASGAYLEDVYPVNLGLSTSGTLTVDYDFLSVPDDMKVFYGSTNDVLIYDTGVINGTGHLVIPFGPTNGFTTNLITIVMNQGNGDPGTVWYYTAQVATPGSTQVYAGGAFTAVGGKNYGSVARFNGDGSVDASFSPGIGTYNVNTGNTDPISALALQSDGKLLAGGAFSHVQMLSVNGLCRFNIDGTLDTAFSTIGTNNGTFNPVTGVADSVNVITLQPDGRILIGGDFTTINQTRRVGIARLNGDGSLDTSFMDTAYNQFAGLINHYHNPDTVNTNDYPQGNHRNAVYAIAQESGGNVIVGGNFLRVGGGSYQHTIEFTINGVVFGVDQAAEHGIHYNARMDIHPRSNVARLIGGVTPGPGNIQFSYDNYTVDKNGGSLFVSLVRTNGNLGDIGATFGVLPGADGQQGIAVFGTDFTYNNAEPMWLSMWNGGRPAIWMYSDAFSGPNYNFSPGNSAQETLTIYNNTLISGNLNANLALSMPYGSSFNLGGELIPMGAALGSQQTSPMTIIDDNFPPGTFSFSQAAYTVNESSNLVTITVTRTNGASGSVQVSYATFNGTAVSPTDYTSVSGTLTFNQGVASKTFTVPIVPTTVNQSDKTVNLRLFGITGGGKPGMTNAVLTIVNNVYGAGHIAFAFATNAVAENAGTAGVVLNRLGASSGTIDVTLISGGGTATNGMNYVGVTNVVHWNDGDALPKTVNIPVLHDGIFTSNLSVNLRLTNGLVNTKANVNVLGLSAITNSTLVISNVDFPGQVEFTSGSYSVKKYGGYALIPVIRTGGQAGTVTVNYSTVNGSALNGVNYTTSSGVLTFTNGVVSQYFQVPIINITNTGLSSLNLVLSNATVSGTALGWNAQGSPSNAVLNIIDSDSVNETPGSSDATYSQFAGFNGNIFALVLQTNNYLIAGGDFSMANGIPRQRLARLTADGTLDGSFLKPSSAYGANNGQILALALQGDGRVLVGGSFTNFNSVAMNRITRLNYDGSLDSTFNPGSGADNPIYAVAQSPVDGKVLVGGAFGRLDGVTYNAVGRLNADGTPDTTFNAGGLGANATVYALAVQTDGKIVIGGDFTAVNGVSCNHLARLNTDGSVDATFNVGTGASDSVRAVAIQLDGRILIGGLFSSYNGNTFIRVGRVNADGSADTSFSPGAGADDMVSCIAIQTDNRILLGGQFTHCNGVTRHHLTRLNPDGTVDPTINFGTGANDYVAAVVAQESTIQGYPSSVPDEKIIIGGVFNQFNGETRNHLARIYGGSISGVGAFQFSLPAYQIDENSTNPATITILRTGGTSGTNSDGSGDIIVPFATSNLTAVAGVNYGSVVTNLVFPMGEVLKTVDIPVMSDGVITPDLTVHLQVDPVAPAEIGDQPTAVLTIINDDSAVNFSSATYQVPKNVVNGVALINVTRLGTSTGTASVIFNTTTNGSAVPGVDFTPVTNALVTFNPGDTNVTVYIPIINNGIAEGPRTVGLQLTNAVNTSLYAPSNATLTIIDTVYSPGSLTFASTNIVVNEGDASAYLTVIRTNGSSGIVSVSYATMSGTALPAINYQTTTGTISFGDGVTNRIIAIPLVDNNIVQGPVNFSVNLLNPAGGAVLADPTNATVTVFDNDSGINFAAATNTIPEDNSLITISVQRIGSTNGAATINYATVNGTAQAGVNYVNTAGSLNFAVGEVLKVITVPLIHDPVATGDLDFTLHLSSPAGAQLIAPSNTVVVLQDAEAGLSFTNATMHVLKNAGLAVVTVVCSNPRVEPVILSSNDVPLQVNYSTADGTAIAGQDYQAVSGTLVFTNGIGTNTFTVPIVNNGFITGDKTFTVSLSNPTAPGQLLTPSTQTVVIDESNTGLKFSQASYSVFKNAVNATITVSRTGYAGSVVSVNYAATNGTAVGGVNYIPTSGTLVFTNGVTSQTFNVSIIANTIVQPDLSVLLQLSNPTNGILVSPSAATLNILENNGSYVIPSGAQVLTNYTSHLADGIISSNDTVQVLFAFRAVAGLNVTNLIAYLQSGNGVVSPSPASQTYGPLVVHGHSVSRTFTFTASGTNAGTILPTFLLYDNAKLIGTNRFTFTLGTWTSSFSNTAAITINDNTSASPYPAVIPVSGVGGSVVKARVTLSKLTHTSPADIDAIVVAPAGANTLIMANAGGALAVTNIVLTFDDVATNGLSSSGRLTTSTNRPTQYFPVQNFP